MRFYSFAKCVGVLFVLSFALMEFPFVGSTAQNAEDQAQPPFEITQVDLFSIKNWNSTQVSILGIRLGMSRREIHMLVSKAGLRLDGDLAQGCLQERPCNVFEGNGDKGMNLIFGGTGVLEKIRIEAQRRNASRQERSKWLVSKFQGATRQFVESYSDSRRIQTLGLSDAMRAEEMTPYSAWDTSSSEFVRNMGGILAKNIRPIHQEYEYCRLGLILHVDFHDQDSSTDAFVDRLMIEFMRPNTCSK